jgi:4'-phosphopantetheinyl transferase
MNTTWQSPSPSLKLSNGTAHVWRLRLDEPELDAANFRPLLNTAECARADRYRFDRDRNRFTTTRGVLRTLLERYTGVNKTKLEFIFSKHDKPALDPNTCDQRIEFNVSHSGSLALIGFTPDHPIGVDVEQTERPVTQDKIAERFFSPDEVARLRQLPEADRNEAFFRCWTRKEAFIKAHGDGLSLPLDSFSVTLGPDEPPRLIRFDGKPSAECWSITALGVGEGYAGAACIASSAPEFQYFEFAG